MIWTTWKFPNMSLTSEEFGPEAWVRAFCQWSTWVWHTLQAWACLTLVHLGTLRWPPQLGVSWRLRSPCRCLLKPWMRRGPGLDLWGPRWRLARPWAEGLSAWQATRQSLRCSRGRMRWPAYYCCTAASGAWPGTGSAQDTPLLLRPVILQDKKVTSYIYHQFLIICIVNLSSHIKSIHLVSLISLFFLGLLVGKFVKFPPPPAGKLQAHLWSKGIWVDFSITCYGRPHVQSCFKIRPVGWRVTLVQRCGFFYVTEQWYQQIFTQNIEAIPG